MGLISWIIFGLIAGALARYIHPGDDPGGSKDIKSLAITAGIGILGAILGGFVGGILGLGGVSGFNLWSFIIAVAGSVGLLFGYRKLLENR